LRQGEPVQFHAANGNRRSNALLDVLQPGIVEEVIDRFALWGLLCWFCGAACQILKLATGVSTTPALCARNLETFKLNLCTLA
jgi:hypothetical protein